MSERNPWAEVGGFRSSQTFEANGIPVEIVHRVVTPTILWNDKYKMHRELVKGIESREKMSDELYSAVVSRLRDGVGYMWEHIDTIAPNGLDMSENGQMLDCRFHLVLADLEEEAKRQRQDNLLKTVGMAAVAKELMEGLDIDG